jgi:rubrerythrin
MVMNVLDVAASKELEMKSCYEKIARESTLVGIRTIFSLLARDEEKHYEMVLALRGGTCPELPTDSTVLETARTMVGSFVGDKDVAGLLRNDLDGYRLALAMEGESVRSYEKLAAVQNDAASRKMLLKILGEERKHYNVVENLYDFASKPEYFLAWAEFSNLREL